MNVCRQSKYVFFFSLCVEVLPLAIRCLMFDNPRSEEDADDDSHTHLYTNISLVSGVGNKVVVVSSVFHPLQVEKLRVLPLFFCD